MQLVFKYFVIRLLTIRTRRCSVGWLISLYWCATSSRKEPSLIHKLMSGSPFVEIRMLRPLSFSFFGIQCAKLFAQGGWKLGALIVVHFVYYCCWDCFIRCSLWWRRWLALKTPGGERGFHPRLSVIVDGLAAIARWARETLGTGCRWCVWHLPRW
jgi:hypothetical protein